MRYRHYEGGICELVCEAATERDHTAMVIYRAEDGSIRCSPKDLFFERIEVDGRPVQRYVEISERD
nr:DUF1653 domain-containing protein [Paraburkholderia humisilvae]